MKGRKTGSDQPRRDRPVRILCEETLADDRAKLTRYTIERQVEEAGPAGLQPRRRRDAATAAGASKQEAPKRVVDELITETIAGCAGRGGNASASGDLKHRLAGDRIGDAKAAAEVLEKIAHAVEAGDHLRPRGGD